MQPIRPSIFEADYEPLQSLEDITAPPSKKVLVSFRNTPIITIRSIIRKKKAPFFTAYVTQRRDTKLGINVATTIENAAEMMHFPVECQIFLADIFDHIK